MSLFIDDGQMDFLVDMDQHGMLVGGGESYEDFQKRTGQIIDIEHELLARLDGGGKEEFDSIELTKNDLIDLELKQDAAAQTLKLFGFDASERIGFFSPKSIGALWGGCTLTDTDSGLTVFLLRRVFRNKGKWLIYSREEILAHEECHAAREVLNDSKLEEYFAYRTSKSNLRRYLGSCFMSSLDALGFLGGMGVLLAVEFYNMFVVSPINLLPLVALALLYPAFMLLRNQYIRWVVARASTKLERARLNALPILFRMTFGEVKELNCAIDAEGFLKEKANTELRFKVICRRFIPSCA